MPLVLQDLRSFESVYCCAVLMMILVAVKGYCICLKAGLPGLEVGV